MGNIHTNFLADLPRGVSPRSLNQQRAPQAQWTRLEDIAGSRVLAYEPHTPGKKVLIGALDKQLVGIEDDRHLLTVAGSRSGKSVGLISNLLFYAGSVLATDPKGELASLTAKRRAALGQRICILDPFSLITGEAAKWRVAYNPMDVLRPGSATLLEDAALLAEAMVVQHAEQREPHWDESAKNFIEGVIVHVATAPQHAKRRHLITVRDLLKRALWVAPDEDGAEGAKPKAKRQPLLLAELMKNAERLEADPATADIGGAVMGAALDFYGKSETERSGVHSTINRHTRFLDYTAFRGILTRSDLDLRDLKRDPKGVSVYLCFPATRVELSRRWMRIFINQMLDAMDREKTRPAASVLVCLDEFPVLGYMKQLETAVGLIASFDVKLWVVIQDWSQGKALYGERWESFAANAGVMQFFANNDQTTTEYVSRRLGKAQVAVVRQSEVTTEQRGQGLTGLTEAIELHDLLTPDEISRLFARGDRLQRQLVLWAGERPMILQRVVYYQKDGPLAPILKSIGMAYLLRTL